MGHPSDGGHSNAGPSSASPSPSSSSPRRRLSSASSPVFLASVSRVVSRVASRISLTQGAAPFGNGLRDITTPSMNPAGDSVSDPSPSQILTVPETRNQLTEEEVRRNFRGTWPIRGSSFFACLSCILGLCNISRFSTMVFLYKGPFLLEFLLLSLVIGIPFLFLMIALGQYLGSGMLDMWYISPAFKGVGFALLYVYVIIGVYTAVPLSWMFIYFKDSFITAREPYKWSLCNSKFATDVCLASLNSSKTDYIGWTVPSYFHGQVLEHRTDDNRIGDMKFELAFNLTIVWFIVFITLSRGIRSYGKTVFAVIITPISLLLVISIRFLEQWGRGISLMFSVPWTSVLNDPWTWLLASREVFLTWVMFGGVILQYSSHNKSDVRIARQVICLSIISLICLILSSMFVACCVHALLLHGLSVLPTSYEHATKLLAAVPVSPTPNFVPINFLAGECLPLSKSASDNSGYQGLRLATEIFPALLAVEGARGISSFWAITFYGMLIMFGLGQQIAIWGCVVESAVSLNYKILPKWQTVLTFALCTAGLLLGLPLTTNMGITAVHFFDFCIGSLWWLAAIYLTLLIAVLLIRGRPYGTDQLVGIVTKRQTVRQWLLPMLIFQWNVLLPISFLICSIAFVQTGQSGSSYSWLGLAQSYKQWAGWVKQLAFIIQCIPLLGIFLVAIFQAFRFLLSKSNMPFHEKVQSLFCPIFPPSLVISNQDSSSSAIRSAVGVINAAFEEDPPPKYTPPPSYSTATARKIANQLIRQNSFPGIELHTVEQDLMRQSLPTISTYNIENEKQHHSSSSSESCTSDTYYNGSKEFFGSSYNDATVAQESSSKNECDDQEMNSETFQIYERDKISSPLSGSSLYSSACQGQLSSLDNCI